MKLRSVFVIWATDIKTSTSVWVKEPNFWQFTTYLLLLFKKRYKKCCSFENSLFSFIVNYLLTALACISVPVYVPHFIETVQQLYLPPSFFQMSVSFVKFPGTSNSRTSNYPEPSFSSSRGYHFYIARHKDPFNITTKLTNLTETRRMPVSKAIIVFLQRETRDWLVGWLILWLINPCFCYLMSISICKHMVRTKLTTQQ